MSNQDTPMTPEEVAALDTILDEDGPDTITEGATEWEAAGSPIVTDDK